MSLAGRFTSRLQTQCLVGRHAPSVRQGFALTLMENEQQFIQDLLSRPPDNLSCKTFPIQDQRRAFTLDFLTPPSPQLSEH